MVCLDLKIRWQLNAMAVISAPVKLGNSQEFLPHLQSIERAFF